MCEADVKVVCVEPMNKTTPFDMMRDKVRCKLIAGYIKLQMSFGYSVVLIGKCRTGKTRLLEQITPDAILDGRAAFFATGWKMPPDILSLPCPDGLFSVDEPLMFSKKEMKDFLNQHKNRVYAISFQVKDHFMDFLPIFKGKKLLIVNIDGKDNIFSSVEDIYRLRNTLAILNSSDAKSFISDK